MTSEFADISSYQQGADIAAYAAGGFRRILLKATEGTTYTNPYFDSWWRKAGAHGLSRGAYHFALPSKSGGAAEADHFVNKVRAAGGLGPRDWVCLDTEDPKERGGAAAEHAARFCERMVALGFGFGVVYSGTWYLEPAGIRAAKLPEGWRQLHIANYSRVPDTAVPLPNGWSPEHVVARQYTDKAHLPGIPGGVDANRVVREWLKEDVVTPEQMKELKDAVGAVPGKVSALFTTEFRRAEHGGKATADVRLGTASEASGIMFLAVAELQERIDRVEHHLASIAGRLDAILAREDRAQPQLLVPPPASPPSTS
jgi:GH25 family lysozyme M1 (1,4-beta-N-acetylmuramidase)